MSDMKIAQLVGLALAAINFRFMKLVALCLNFVLFFWVAIWSPNWTSVAAAALFAGASWAITKEADSPRQGASNEQG